MQTEYKSPCKKWFLVAVELFYNRHEFLSDRCVLASQKPEVSLTDIWLPADKRQEKSSREIIDNMIYVNKKIESKNLLQRPKPENGLVFFRLWNLAKK